MPIYDYECGYCGAIFEAIAPIKQTTMECPMCDRPGTYQVKAKRIISASGVYTGNDAAGWIKSVLEVVDKSESATPADRRFLKDPTRSNYKRWMKSRGLRPYEPGERTKPMPPDDADLQHNVALRHLKRNRIEVYKGGK